MEFRLLGPLEVVDGEHQLPLGSTKQRALLAILLLRANSIVSRDTLIDELWGERPPARAAHSVEAYVSRLRKQLHAEQQRQPVLLTRPGGYMLLVGTDELDVQRFERIAEEGRRALAVGAPERAADKLREALGLWRGPALADLAFEPFAQPVIDRLEALRVGALEERLEAELALGRHNGLVAELETLVAQHPLRERLRGQLMRALYRSGRQTEALDVYRSGRRRLVDELGLEPGPELRSIEAAILTQDPALELPIPKSPAADARPKGMPGPSRPSRRDRRAVIAAAAFVTVAITTVTTVALTRHARGGLARVAPNHVGIIDPRTNDLVAQVPVGLRPGAIAAGKKGPIWVADVDDRDLTRIDAETRTTGRRLRLSGTPTALAVGSGSVWVVAGLLGRLLRVDPQFNRVAASLRIARPVPFVAGGLTVGDGSVWAVFGDSTLARVEPRGSSFERRAVAGDLPSGIVYYANALWVANGRGGDVYRFNPATFASGPLKRITVGNGLAGIAAGAGAVWVAATSDDRVSRISPETSTPLQIRVGDGPSAIAVGQGSVWVANRGDGTISRIDPVEGRVVKTIRVGNAPAGIAVARGLVWVSVQAR